MYYNVVELEALISFQLNQLSNTNDGDKILEKIAVICAREYLKDKNVFLSDGPDWGGDGGFDGIFTTDNLEIGKIAASTQSDFNRKIKQEIEKTKDIKYLIYVSNQEIKNSRQQNCRNKYPDKTIIFLAHDTLTTMILDLPECQALLCVPEERNKLIIEELAKHNQFQNEEGIIKQYISRNVINQRDGNALSLYQYCKNPSEFTVIEASAGSGKTCAIKKTIHTILHKRENGDKIPLYVHFDMYKSQDLLKAIDSTFCAFKDCIIESCIIFIDGIDELSDSQLKLLIHDIDIWKNNQSLGRFVIFIGRTGEYDRTIFEKYSPSYLQLANPSQEEIEIYVQQQGLPEYKRKKIIDFLFNKLHTSNFFIIKCLTAYFKNTNNKLNSICDLYQYIASQELGILRISNNANLYKEAFLTIFERKNEIRINKSSLKSINIFSHRIVLEYLAAQYLSNLQKQDFFRYATVGYCVVPKIKNVVGLSLSLIASKDFVKYTAIFKKLLQKRVNHSTLLKCEIVNLSDDIKEKLVHEITEDIVKERNPYRYEQDFYNYFFDSTTIKSNFDWLQKRINVETDINNLTEIFHIVFLLAVEKKTQFPEDFKNFVLSYLRTLIEQDNIQKYYLISIVVYIVGVLDYSSAQIDTIFEMLLGFVAKYWKNEILENVCRLIDKYKIAISENQYHLLLITTKKIKDDNNSHGAHTVPSQIDDSYNPKPMQLQYYDSFYVVSSSFFNNNPHYVWTVFSTILKWNSEDNNSFLNDDKLCNTLAQTLSKKDHYQDSDYKLLKEIIVNHYHSNKVLQKALIEYSPNVLKEAFVFCLKDWDEGSNNIFYTIAFDCYLETACKNKELLKELIDSLSAANVSIDLIPFERYACIFNQDLIPILPQSIAEKILQSQNEITAINKNEDNYKQLLEDSLHEAFDPVLRKPSMNKILDALGEEISLSDCIKLGHKEYTRQHSDYSPFCLFTIEELIRGDHNISKSELKTWWETGNLVWKSVFMSIRYIHRYDLSFLLLNEGEINIIKQWASNLLQNFPIQTITDQVNWQHIFLSALLNDNDMRNALYDLLYKNRKRFIGFVGVGIIRMFDGGIVDEQSYSIKYLESFFSKAEIASFISDNLNYILQNKNSLLSVGDYLSNSELNCVDEAITQRINDGILAFFTNNLTQINYEAGHLLSYCEKNNITILSFSKDLIKKSLCFDKESMRFKENQAAMFLKLFVKRTPQETTHINEILYDLFNETDDFLEKKYIAEILINYRDSHIDVFIWYLKYLQKPDSTITEMFVDFNRAPNFYCNKLRCIHHLERLWIVASLRDTEKTRIMKSIVSNSYIKIAESIKTKFQYYILRFSINRLIRKTHSIEIEDIQQRCALIFADNYSQFHLI